MTLEREQTPRCALRRLLLGAVLIQIKAAVAPSNSMILVLFRSEGYGDMTGSVSLTTWLSCVMLSAILALGSGVARGQMNADLPHDMDLLEQSISATIAAIDSGDRNAARVAMETLFQDWRRFRRMDFDGAPNDSQFVPDMESGQVIIKVLDVDGKIIRRIPPEFMVKLADKIGESTGLVVNETLE